MELSKIQDDHITPSQRRNKICDATNIREQVLRLFMEEWNLKTGRKSKKLYNPPSSFFR